jgi:transcriptional regulator with XRE-family HTH domain
MAELGDFLRTRRARLQPHDVGLPDYGRRRVPGLRREELAQLAGVSVDYYVRLEQGRDIQPSDSVLDAIAGALRLSEDERSHLFTLVRPRKRARRRPVERVRPGVQRLLDRIEFPAFVLGRRMDVLAFNTLAAALLGDFRERNTLRFMFLDDGARTLYPDWEQVAAEGVAYLRLTAAEDPDDAQLVELIGELSLQSELFRRLWAKHDVKSKTFGVKVYDHPQVGRLELDYESLKLPDADQTLVTYTAEPGSPSETALQLLAQLSREQDRGAVGDDDRVFEVRRR